MKIKMDAAKCNQCGACVEICPVNAIQLNPVATIDSTRCTGCRMCLISCPQKAIRA